MRATRCGIDAPLYSMVSIGDIGPVLSAPSRVSSRPARNNRPGCQAGAASIVAGGCQGVPSRSMALTIVSNLRITAVTTTRLGLPLARQRPPIGCAVGARPAIPLLAVTINAYRHQQCFMGINTNRQHGILRFSAVPGRTGLSRVRSTGSYQVTIRSRAPQIGPLSWRQVYLKTLHQSSCESGTTPRPPILTESHPFDYAQDELLKVLFCLCL